MSDELRLLRQKVESLVEAAADVRDRLLNCLEVAPRRPADALALARGAVETLAKQVLVAVRIKPPDMLEACLRELEKPETMSRALVPAEIITMLHKVRTIGNKALHDDLRLAVSTDDVISVLGDVLRVTRWYFGEFARGPRLDPVLRPAPVRAPNPEFKSPLPPALSASRDPLAEYLSEKIIQQCAHWFRPDARFAFHPRDQFVPLSVLWDNGTQTEDIVNDLVERLRAKAENRLAISAS